MEGDEFDEALRNWNNGNISDMSRADLIAVALHFEQLFNMSISEMDKR